MRVDRINIRGFGKLVGKKLSFPRDKVTLILAENECGKSTLAAAILAGLCGFHNRKQRGELVKPLDVHKPWNGDEYSLEMEIEAQGKRLVVERDFARDGFVVRDYHTNKDITELFSPDLTSHFLGLPRDDFRRIAFISGKEVHQFSPSTNIQSRFSALVDGAEQDSGVEAAVETLRGARYRFGSSNVLVETALKRLNSEIEQKYKELQTLDEELENASADVTELEDAQSRYSELSEQLKQLDQEYTAARLAETREKIAAIERDSKDATALEEELAELENYAKFPALRQDQLNSAITRLKEHKHNLSEINRSIDALKRDSDELVAKLAEHYQFEAADDDDLDTLKTLTDAVKNAQDNVERISSEIEKESRRLKDEGIEVESALELWRKFELLPKAERDFVHGYREKELKLAAEQQSQDSLKSQMLSELKAIAQKRASLRTQGRLIAGFGVLATVSAVVLVIVAGLSWPYGAAIGIPSMLLAALGSLRMSKAYSVDSDEKARLEMRKEEAEIRAQEITAEECERAERLKTIACDMGFSDADSLLEAIRTCENSLSQAEGLKSLQISLSYAQSDLDHHCRRSEGHLHRLGAAINEQEEVLDALERTKAKLSHYLSLKRRYREVQSELNKESQNSSRTEQAIIEEQRIIESILSEAGIDTSLPMDDAAKHFASAKEKHLRYHRIMDELLPAALGRTPSGGELDELRKEEAYWVQQLEDPEMRASRPSSSVEADRQVVRTELHTTTNRCREAERRIGVCVDNYRRKYPKIQEELQLLEAEMKKASRFSEAVNIATDVLSEVAEDTHRRWAVALNRQANSILPYLNPEYHDLKFDESMGFTIRRTSDKTILDKTCVDTALSTGAKDQIYLAVRLACCRELSDAGEAAPVILDDPFIAADDERFAKAMKYVACELVRKHQVILLSCHGGRHKALNQEPWFTNNVTIVEV